MMVRIFVSFVLMFLPFYVLSSEQTAHLEDMTPDLRDNSSLKRGLALFSNYCLGCHELGYARFERAANDLGIPNKEFTESLLPAGKKIGDLMTNSLNSQNAKAWFGNTPPDLTLEARVRGSDWIYSYLKAFYEDKTRPWGVNNTVFPNVGMPNILENLQGVRQKVCAHAVANGESLSEQECGIIVQKTEGQLTEDQFDQVAYDITNFLVYIGEPSRLQSESLGVKVLLFIVLFGIFAYLLNKEYWREVGGH